MQSKKALYDVAVYTVGHSNVEFEKLLGLLNEIEVLVDVRSVPFSKYVPQFNMGNIKESLEDVGIGYVFMKDKQVGNVLGGRPKDEDCYEDGKIIYENVKKKEWYKEGISALTELANKKRTVIMCSEENPYKCHRHHLITQSLLNEGANVIHIRGGGVVEEIKKAEKKVVQLTLI